MISYRSVLFVPGDQPRRIAKALASSADLVCIDLEDAVMPAAKDLARAEVTAVVLAGAGRQRPLAVRFNHPGTAAGIRDLNALTTWADWPDTILVPKVECAGEVRLLNHLLTEIGAPTKIVPTIESAAGLKQATQIAALPNLGALFFGGFDLAAELQAAPEWEPWLLARQTIVLAAALGKIPAIDVPYIEYRDPEGLAKESARVRALGFTGKAAIHPDQIAVIQKAFSPSAAEIAWAQQVVSAVAAQPGRGAVSVNGQMIDPPILRRATAILQLTPTPPDLETADPGPSGTD